MFVDDSIAAGSKDVVEKVGKNLRSMEKEKNDNQYKEKAGE